MPKSLAYETVELFQKLAKNDQQALSMLMHHYNQSLHRLVIGIIANESIAAEIVSDIYQRLWEHRKKVGKMENPAGWLYTTARHHTLNSLKKEKRIKIIPLDPNSSTLATINPITELDLGEMLRRIRQVIGGLSPRQKLIYQLSRNHGLNRKQIAFKLGLSESTVKNHLTEALKKIKAVIMALLSFFIC